MARLAEAPERDRDRYLTSGARLVDSAGLPYRYLPSRELELRSFALSTDSRFGSGHRDRFRRRIKWLCVIGFLALCSVAGWAYYS